MIVTFGDDTTRDIFNRANTKAARRIPKEIWPVCKRKLDMIDWATKVSDLGFPPGNNLEPLKGDLAGWYSIRINQQYRIIFKFNGGNAYEVTIVDYH